MKIKLIETEDKYLYKFDEYIYDINEYYMNGKELKETFESKWFVIDEFPKLLQKKEIVKVNERWTLKNKDLYNETIPLVVDEHSKDKYKSLVESDLYEYTYEEKEVYKAIDLEIEKIGEINDSIPFEHKEIIETERGWYSRGKRKVYLIKYVKFSLKDNCLTPVPIKELTKPCMLNRDYLYQILTDYIKRNVDLNYAKVKSDYDWRFEVVTNNEKETCILCWYNHERDNAYTLQNLYAKNYKELINKLEKMKKDIIKYINREHTCPNCGGTGCIVTKFDVNKWFDKGE